MDAMKSSKTARLGWRIVYAIAVICIAAIALIVYRLHVMEKAENRIAINSDNVQSIEVINIVGLAASAKFVTHTEDIERICEVFNTVEMMKCREPKNVPVVLGDPHIQFLFNFPSGTSKQYMYVSGRYLVTDFYDRTASRADYAADTIYLIYSDEFEELWKLDYEEREQWWSSEENQFEDKKN
jgi:hypothetical protein